MAGVFGIILMIFIPPIIFSISSMVVADTMDIKILLLLNSLAISFKTFNAISGFTPKKTTSDALVSSLAESVATAPKPAKSSFFLSSASKT